MKDIPLENVRNFVLMGHTGAGKTTLVDHIMQRLGVAERAGSTEDGSSFSDWNDEERKRQISVFAKPFEAVYELGGQKHCMVISDTPGYVDFYGQVVAASAVADAALIVIDAASGIQVGTTRAWQRADELKLPRAIVLTGVGKENVDFEAAVQAIQDVWGNKCIPATLPTADLSAIADILSPEAPPESLADRARDIKGQLVEFAAETDDTLIEKYLNGEDLTAEELSNGLHGAVKSCDLVPIFCVASTKDIGITQLLDSAVRFFPAPNERKVQDAEGNEIDTSTSAPFCGKVWRSVTDPYVGQLTFIRVYGGTLKADSEFFNATRGKKERVGTLYTINGKTQEPVPEAEAGDIVAVAKLKDTHLNDSVCAVGQQIVFAPTEFPKPVTSYAITPKTQGDEDKLAGGLQRLAEEDPTLVVERNTETHELILSGMGDIHIDIAVSRLKTSNNVEVELHTPKVAYKETVTSLGEGHYKHKKQSGGRGQYGEVYLRVEKKQDGEEDWFVNAIVGGAIPSNFIPAVQKGLVEGMAKGAVAGYPVVEAKVTVYDGSYHDVDSSEIAFKIAAARAFREGMGAAKPVLLEPIMNVKVMVPEEYMGDVTGDLNHKRGRILGMGSEHGLQVMSAEVPQAELFKYSSELRSITGGRGSFEMEFARYEAVPSNIAQKVVAESAKDAEDED